MLLDHTLRLFEIYTFPRSIDLLEGDASVLLMALIRYMNAIPDSLSRAEKTAIVLASHRKFFKTFLTDECVLEMLRCLRRRHADCSRCFYLGTVQDQLMEKLSSTADSSFGSGEIAHFLISGESSKHMSIAITLGMLVHSRNCLYTLLFDCGGLDLLFDGLQGEDEEMFQLCVRSLVMVARSSGIRYQEKQDLRNEVSCEVGKSIEDPVVFELDNGKTVRADRKQLLAKSDYFQGLWVFASAMIFLRRYSGFFC